MQDVAIIGARQSVLSRKCGVAIRELCFEAYTEAMEGLDITNKDIDASIICSAPEYDKQCSRRQVMNEATLPDLSDSSPFDHSTALMAQHRFESLPQECRTIWCDCAPRQVRAHNDK